MTVRQDLSAFRGVAYEIARGWWTYVLRGVLAILFGILAWVYPGLTITVLVVIFGAYLIADGASEIYAAFFAKNLTGGGRFVLGLAGVATIALGLVVWIWPDVTAEVLMILIGVWALIAGLGAIAFAVRHREEIAHEWLLGLTGLAAAIFGILVIIFPGSGALSLAWLIGVYSIAFGALLVAVGFDLRAVKDRFERAGGERREA